MGQRILVVEDEEALLELLRYNLEKAGYDVETIKHGDEAERRLRELLPDLLLLDWMLPGTSGVELCRRLRKRAAPRRPPIIMLTARGEESDRLVGLDTGVDDYVVKPFSVSDLIARIAVLLRRAEPVGLAGVLKVGDIELDRDAMAVKRQGEMVHLGLTDFRLLEFLMQWPGRVFTRHQLFANVWGSDVFFDERTVDVHVGRLRRALSQRWKSDLIRAEPGVGYSFDGAAQRPASEPIDSLT